MALRTRKPTGAVLAPFILLEGVEGSGKTYAGVALSTHGDDADVKAIAPPLWKPAGFTGPAVDGHKLPDFLKTITKPAAQAPQPSVAPERDGENAPREAGVSNDVAAFKRAVGA